MTVAIVSICHKGELEIKTAFLIYSLRKYLQGTYSLYVGIPEENQFIKQPSDLFKDFCNKNDVEIFDFKNEYLNTIDSLKEGDLISNKLYIWNQVFVEDYIVFMDSDTMILRPFSVYDLVSGTNEIKIKPSDWFNVKQWKELYSLAGIPYPSKKVISSVDRIEMPPYFNSGIIILNRTHIPLVTKHWIEYYLLISDLQIIQKIQFPVFHRNQIALALAMMRCNIDYILLDEIFNFPIRAKKMNPNDLPFIIHYHSSNMICSLPLLYNEFKEFITIHKKLLEIDYGSWGKILSEKIFDKTYIFIQMKKRIIKNWFENTSIIM